MKPASPRSKDIFLAAAEVTSPSERQAYLDAACAGDDALRHDVEEMLEHHERLGSFLQLSAGAVAPTIDPPSVENPGTVIAGRYRLLEQIGEGGMGAVWMAEQTEPVRRLVAVKLIKPGMDSRQVTARFEGERQALALMDHPNIAKVLDAGATSDGRPFFVMELVKGLPITRYCDDHRLTPRQRLELFAPVCQAIQHAHQKGIIHRDIKPSNVLIALYDERPVPKVIDFGVAKATGQQLTEESLHTGFGAVVGTVEYMSPEQASFNQLDVDTRSDIYSLGVLLYELLAGSPPFTRKDLEKAGLLEMLRVIREQEPSKPSTKLSTADGLPALAANRGTEPKRLTKLVRGELDWIVMKALEKDRNRRYETANGFAMDVQRYLADEPVQAGPPSATYRVRKFVRRNKVGLVVAGLVLLFLVLLGSGIGWMVRDRIARQTAAETLSELAWQDALRLKEEKRLPEAIEAAKRAEALLADGGNPQLRQRVGELVKDLGMVVRLEEILLQQAEVRDGRFNSYGAIPEYALAFRQYGIDVERLDAQEAADKLRGRTVIRAELAAALDFWAHLTARSRKADDPLLRHLLAVAQRVDPDELRTLIRVAIQTRDRPTLERLAASDEIAALPALAQCALGKALCTTGATERGVLVLRQAQQQYPGEFWIYHELGMALSHPNPPQNAEAIRFLTAATALRPHSPGVYVNLGATLLDSGDVAGAIAAYQKAIALKPDYAMAHTNLGRALQEQGDVAGAFAAHQRALALNPNDALAHTNWGALLHSQGDLAGALAAFDKAIALEPAFAIAHNNRGIVLRDRGDLPGAIAAHQKAIALEPDYAAAHCNLGAALSGKGDLIGAVAAIERAIALRPDFAKAHYDLGFVLLYMKRDLPGAITAFEKTIALKSDSVADAHQGLGEALYRSGDVPRALVAYRKAIALRPNDGSFHSNLGRILRAQGDVPGAMAAFQKAIALKPDLPEPHYNLGNAHYDQGDLPAAITAYREAIRLKPNHAEAHCNLGDVLRRSGQFKEALAVLRRGHELGSQNPRWSYPSAQWVKECERFVELDLKLPSMLRGETAPADTAERLEFAQLCAIKRLPAAAARFYEGAFAAQPDLATSPKAGHRYDAACTAAQAGCGRGEDAAKLEDSERARWRRQALAWLRADLAHWIESLKSNTPQGNTAAREKLLHWQRDVDLAGLRDAAALDQIPEAEREEWRRLWNEVTLTVEKTRPAEAPKKVPE